MTHDELVELGRKWLCSKAPIVITELKSRHEEPDVIAFGATLKRAYKGSTRLVGYGSVLIECKASRSDFLSDKKKSFRDYPESGMGTFRFYLAPKGLINVAELPEHWGLLEPAGSRIKCVKWPEAQERNSQAEMELLISTMRRIRIPEGDHVSLKVYQIETKNTATLSVLEEGAAV